MLAAFDYDLVRAEKLLLIDNKWEKLEEFEKFEEKVRMQHAGY